MKSISKSIFIILTVLNLLKVSAVYAENGGIVGQGGTGSESQLAGEHAVYSQILSKIAIFFIDYPDKEKYFEDVKADKLVDTITNLKLEITNDILIDDDKVVRTCLNFAKLKKIRCNYSELQEISNSPKAQFVLMFHEVLGLMGLEETSPENPTMIDGYKISSNLAPFVQKTSNWDLVAIEENYEDIDPLSKEALKRNRRKNRSNMNSFFIANFEDFRFFGKRKLTKYEKLSKGLLKCVMKLVDRNKGAYEWPRIAANLLRPVFSSGKVIQDKVIIKKTTKKCNQVYRSLKKYRNIDLDYDILSKKLDEVKFSDERLYRFLFTQYAGRPLCRSSQIKLVAGVWSLGVSIGPSRTKCIMPNGVVRTYIGLLLGYTMTILDASINYSETDYSRKYSVSSIGIANGISQEKPQYSRPSYVIGLGSIDTDVSKTRSQGVGLSIARIDVAEVQAGFRFFNGNRRWDLLFDMLKGKVRH